MFSVQILKAFLLICVLQSIVDASNPPQESRVAISNGDLLFTLSLNHAAERYLVFNSPDRLILDAGPRSDFFRSHDGSVNLNSAPVLLHEIDNTKPFTFSAKLTTSLKETYDAGTFYVYSNYTNWLKFAYELDERLITRIVTVKTVETSDDNNHEPVIEPFVYLKISSDTKSLGFYYSKDNITWQMVRYMKNEFPKKTWIGISSQSPIGYGLRSQFEHLTLTDKPVSNFRLGV